MNRVDSKSKKLNQKYKRTAIKEITATFNQEIVHIAGLITPGKPGDLSDTELSSGAQSLQDADSVLSMPSDDLMKKSAQKIVEDFRVSLSKALESVGDCSNSEKHINELIYRANFRFSDL